jgi:hypothetical protein
MLWEEVAAAGVRTFLSEGDRGLKMKALCKNAQELTTDTPLPQPCERSCCVAVQETRSLKTSTLTDAITITDFLASLPGQQRIYFTMELWPADFERWVRDFAGRMTRLAIVLLAGHGRSPLQTSRMFSRRGNNMPKRSSLASGEARRSRRS